MNTEYEPFLVCTIDNIKADMEIYGKEEIITYSAIFLSLPKRLQKKWVAEHERRYEELKAGVNVALYIKGRAYFLWQHYANLLNEA